MKKRKVLVVGNGMVGHQFIENLLNHHQEYDIVTINEEPRLAYDRVHLTSYLTGSTADDLALTSDAYYRENHITYHLNDRVTAIHKQQHTVSLLSGRRESYDILILATGSYALVPPISGSDQAHCHVYRTLEDLDAIEASSHSSNSGVIIGGGLLGLEAANAVKNLGLNTHVVEFADRLMAVQLDQAGGECLKQKISDLGVHVHTSKATTAIVAGDNARYKMVFADGSDLETDMIVFSAGIRPRDELASSAGLRLGERGGFAINDYCQTSDPDIYAIGECASWHNQTFGLVAPGYQMAKVAAQHLHHPDTASVFQGADMSTKLKLLGVDVASIGDVHGHDTNTYSYTYNDDIEQTYLRLILSQDKQRIVGAVLVGDAQAYTRLQQIRQNQLPLPSPASALILPHSANDAADAVGIEALPNEAVVCSCFDVTKHQIINAVNAGCTTIDELKATTKVSTGCGGCSGLAKQVLEHELEKHGVAVNRSLCEHFAYSRQELCDIIRVQQIKTFDDLLAEYGSGQGCEICKTTAGSIFASFWNDYILKQPHIELQETNDLYLGNLQKNGTYSVVPRIPAGEITPDKLIVIGNVAKRFNLYTKITGGQRIDLFGAQLNDLPDIWRELIDAGFETGHAYGKSLRTVKSCVGQTWCRYGVQDSMACALDLENRYKGLRSPHKLKFAVSGCTRECAEAQSKDIGVIATDKGFNLYVCGNGGMRPRHADLLATDLSYPQLIQYIDRVLMFYIRTADRLQRTSVWLENLEGGLDYLKDVIINDKLGIAHALERDMQHTVSQYQCEWKTTLESPEQLQRFRHFINSDERDNNVQFSHKRGQITPLPAQQSQSIDIINI